MTKTSASSLLLVLVPGADWAYVIAAGLRDRSVLPAVGGLLAGYVLLTAVVAPGFAALITRSPTVLTALTMLGALYLIWLGINALFRPAAPEAAVGQGGGPWTRRAMKGAGISGLNPKALLLFLADVVAYPDPDDLLGQVRVHLVEVHQLREHPAQGLRGRVGGQQLHLHAGVVQKCTPKSVPA